MVVPWAQPTTSDSSSEDLTPLPVLADLRARILHTGVQMRDSDPELDRLTMYLRRALLAYSAAAATMGRGKLHEVNNTLDSQITRGVLDLPLNVGR